MGKDYHKVIVWFSFEDDIDLARIQLIYHEEGERYFFFHSLEEKIFPKDDDDDVYTKNKPPPVLAHY